MIAKPIKYLRIERFKCFEDQNITFGKLTLLAGKNGSGKSSIIQALLLLRQAYVLGSLDKNEFPLNGDLVKIGTAVDALYGGSQKDSIAFTLSSNGPDEEIKSCEALYDKEHPNQHILKLISKSNFTPSCNLFASRFSYLTAERLGPRLTYPMSELSKDKMHVGVQGEYTAHCLAEFGADPIPNKDLALKDQSIDNESNKLNLTLEYQTKLWLRQIIPNITFNVETIIKADSVRLEVKVYGGETDYLRPTNMGFGFCYTLPIVVAALMAEPDSMIIVENPEAHLHPAGQSNISQLLARVAQNGVQVIVETHSDHILNGLRVAAKNGIIESDGIEVHFSDRGNNMGSIIVTHPKIHVDGGISNWPAGFFDQYEKDLEALI